MWDLAIIIDFLHVPHINISRGQQEPETTETQTQRRKEADYCNVFGEMSDRDKLMVCHYLPTGL